MLGALVGFLAVRWRDALLSWSTLSHRTQPGELRWAGDGGRVSCSPGTPRCWPRPIWCPAREAESLQQLAGWTQVKMQLQSQRLTRGVFLALAVFHKAFYKVALACHIRAHPSQCNCFLLDKIILGTGWPPAGGVNLHSLMTHLWPQTLLVQEVLLTRKW